MSLIHELRQKPREYKIKLVWAAILFSLVFMLGLWLITAGYGKNPAPDTTLFETIKRGFKDIKENYERK